MRAPLYYIHKSLAVKPAFILAEHMGASHRALKRALWSEMNQRLSWLKDATVLRILDDLEECIERMRKKALAVKKSQ
jgi:hypothetical protein